jgi:hypothetical protein
MLRRRSVPFAPLWRALAALAVATLLAGCTVTFVEREGAGSRPPEDVNAVIQVFEPRGGEGSSYEIGSEISFVIRSRLAGYVTLTSLGPDGDVDVFARNLPVPARREVVLDGSQQGVVFVVEPPRGWHRVRASFTPRRTDANRVTFRGRVGEDDWSAAIQVDVAPFEVRDVAETRFYVR